MGWATSAITTLRSGGVVQFRPRGHSMKPRIKSGQLVTVEPLAGNHPKPGEVVLCRVKGTDYLHLVKSVGPRGYLISNNHGRENGWTTIDNIFGRVVKVEP